MYTYCVSCSMLQTWKMKNVDHWLFGFRQTELGWQWSYDKASKSRKCSFPGRIMMSTVTPCLCAVLEILFRTSPLWQSTVRLYKEGCQTSPCLSLLRIWWRVKRAEEIRRALLSIMYTSNFKWLALYVQCKTVSCFQEVSEWHNLIKQSTRIPCWIVLVYYSSANYII
jgi:hypothetical protein